MEIKEMDVAALEARMAQIAIDCEAEGADTEALLSEIRAIKAELEERKKAEAAKEEIRKDVAGGAGKKIDAPIQEERKMFDVNSVEYRNAWLKDLQGTLTAEERTEYGFTQSGTYATNAIPTIIADKFFEKMKKLAPMLDEITLMHVAGNLKFVTEGTRNAAAKHTENATVNPAQDTTVAVTLGAYEFVKLIGISKSAMMMSTDAFENWLVEMVAGDLARKIDDYILNDTSNGIAAITYTTGTNQIVNTQTYTYKNIVDMIALLPAAYDAEAKFVINKKTLWGDVANIVNSAGNPIFIMDTEGGMTGRLLGYPVVVDDYVTTSNKAIYLGAYKNVVGNMSEGPMVERNDQVGFKEAQILFRGYASFDSKPANTEAFVRLVSTTA